MCNLVMLRALISAIVAVTSTASLAGDISFDLKYGVLAGLTGDPAPDGQAWNEAARLGIEQIRKSLDRLKLSGIKVELSDSQDSQGAPQPGVEGAQKLVNVDHVQVVVGDFYSSVTSAVATSVTIPNNVLVFTGGTNPALSKLNAGKAVALVWEPVAADDIQGKVLAHILAQELGAKAKVNVAARNDGYGAALSAIFRDAWTAGGGTISKFVIYNQDQPTLETEAQQVADGNPAVGCLSISAKPSRS
jgi:branched-chain amino acid transport system substrate-binding protein